MIAAIWPDHLIHGKDHAHSSQLQNMQLKTRYTSVSVVFTHDAGDRL